MERWLYVCNFWSRGTPREICDVEDRDRGRDPDERRACSLRFWCSWLLPVRCWVCLSSDRGEDGHVRTDDGGPGTLVFTSPTETVFASGPRRSSQTRAASARLRALSRP